MSTLTVQVTDSSFESEVIQSMLPVLVYYWAEWSEECRYMRPVIDAVAQSKQSSVKVALLNVDENPAAAENCAIRTVPTMILFILGEERRRIEGVSNQTHLVSTIEVDIKTKSDIGIRDETDSVN